MPASLRHYCRIVCSLFVHLRLNCQTVCKPGSVPSRDGDGHSSGTFVTERLARPTRAAARRPARHGFDAAPAAPTWSCSRWGFPCHHHYWRRGALLPHHFTLTAPPKRRSAVCFLWHCPWGRPRRPLTGTVSPWSPDFPPPAQMLTWAESGHPTVWHGIVWAELVALSKCGEAAKINHGDSEAVRVPSLGHCLTVSVVKSFLALSAFSLARTCRR
jgi:hypothetical protein